jgi:hypothetical protein
VCRFHFPLPPLRSTQILSPLLNPNAKLQLKAQFIFNKLNEMDMGQDISFDDFLNILQMDEQTCTY